MSDRRADAIAQIDQTLRSAGIYLAVEERDGAIVLSGEVLSPAEHEAALDVATAVAQPLGLGVEDAIEVLEGDVVQSFDDLGNEEFVAFDQDRASAAMTTGAVDPLEVEPDFTRVIGTTESSHSVDEGETYFPPIDPVVRTSGDQEGLEVVGGFSASAMEEERGEPGPLPSDDDLADAVRRELYEDAATAELARDIHVLARGRTVTLRGLVETIEDAEEVEAVAARVPGVAEIREELDVAILPHPAEERGATG